MPSASQNGKNLSEASSPARNNARGDSLDIPISNSSDLLAPLLDTLFEEAVADVTKTTLAVLPDWRPAEFRTNHKPKLSSVGKKYDVVISTSPSVKLEFIYTPGNDGSFFSFRKEAELAFSIISNSAPLLLQDAPKLQGQSHLGGFPSESLIRYLRGAITLAQQSTKIDANNLGTAYVNFNSRCEVEVVEETTHALSLQNLPALYLDALKGKTIPKPTLSPAEIRLQAIPIERALKSVFSGSMGGIPTSYPTAVELSDLADALIVEMLSSDLPLGSLKDTFIAAASVVASKWRPENFHLTDVGRKQLAFVTLRCIASMDSDGADQFICAVRAIPIFNTSELSPYLMRILKIGGHIDPEGSFSKLP